jgi:hypothetical protein
MDPQTHYICLEERFLKKWIEKQFIHFDRFFLQFLCVIDYELWEFFNYSEKKDLFNISPKWIHRYTIYVWKEDCSTKRIEKQFIHIDSFFRGLYIVYEF